MTFYNVQEIKETKHSKDLVHSEKTSLSRREVEDLIVTYTFRALVSKCSKDYFGWTMVFHMENCDTITMRIVEDK